MIELKEVTKFYKTGEVETLALKEVSFTVKEGEFIAIMGPSGSGKSTLMHIMSFLDRPTRGECFFEGKGMSEFSDSELALIRNRKMGFVFQTFNLLQRNNVFENVKLPLLYSGLKKELVEERVREVIEKVGLSERIKHHPNQLSGGEQQRVAIARALVNEPQVIFADEPTGNLDSKTGNTIMALLQDLNDKGHTIVLVTHEKYTSEHAERIIYLKDGAVIQDNKVAKRRIARNNSDLQK